MTVPGTGIGVVHSWLSSGRSIGKAGSFGVKGAGDSDAGAAVVAKVENPQRFAHAGASALDQRQRDGTAQGRAETGGRDKPERPARTVQGDHMRAGRQRR